MRERHGLPVVFRGGPSRWWDDLNLCLIRDGLGRKRWELEDLHDVLNEWTWDQPSVLLLSASIYRLPLINSHCFKQSLIGTSLVVPINGWLRFHAPSAGGLGLNPGQGTSRLSRWLSDKESICQCRRHKRSGFIPGVQDPLEEGMETHSSNLAWRIPWTEDPGSLQSIRIQIVGHDWSDLAHSRQTVNGFQVFYCKIESSQSLRNILSQKTNLYFFSLKY